MKGDLTMAQLSKALFSSTKEDWATPQDFFDKLDEEFHFDLDPCADAENAKCKEYFTITYTTKRKFASLKAA